MTQKYVAVICTSSGISVFESGAIDRKPTEKEIEAFVQKYNENLEKEMETSLGKLLGDLIDKEHSKPCFVRIEERLYL